MKYKGIELKEFESEKPVLFDPPKRMLVWDYVDGTPIEKDVIAFIPNRYHKVIEQTSVYIHCAEIPEESSELATNIQLAEWLAKGFGIMKQFISGYISNRIYFNEDIENSTVGNGILVRKWGDKEWHEPTLEYLGLEDK